MKPVRLLELEEEDLYCSRRCNSTVQKYLIDHFVGGFCLYWTETVKVDGGGEDDRVPSGGLRMYLKLTHTVS